MPLWGARQLQHGPSRVCQVPGRSIPDHRHKIGFSGNSSAGDRAMFLSRRNDQRSDVFTRFIPKRAKSQEIFMRGPITLACLIPCLTLGLTLGAAAGQGNPRIVYTHHALKVNLRDLDLTRPADVEALRERIDAAADEVCNGRPDKGNRYSPEEQRVLLPAYEKCRADAVQRALASLAAAPSPLALALPKKP
jgi:UrcA family protein